MGFKHIMNIMEGGQNNPSFLDTGSMLLPN